MIKFNTCIVKMLFINWDIFCHCKIRNMKHNLPPKAVKPLTLGIGIVSISDFSLMFVTHVHHKSKTALCLEKKTKQAYKQTIHSLIPLPEPIFIKHRRYVHKKRDKNNVMA